MSDVERAKELRETKKLLSLANRRLNDLAMRQTKAIQFIDRLLDVKGRGWTQMTLLYEIKDLLEGNE